MTNRTTNNRRQHRPCSQSQQLGKQTVNVPDGVRALAMVYTVSQTWRGIDDTECGFCRGTIFDELDKPFYGDKCQRPCR